MKEPPVGSGACCLPSAQGLAYLKVGPECHVVGMMNLETVFQQLFAMGQQPDEATNDELVSMARKFNYISREHSIEADYAIALRQAYVSQQLAILRKVRLARSRCLGKRIQYELVESVLQQALPNALEEYLDFELSVESAGVDPNGNQDWTDFQQKDRRCD